jgi:hypothetical protein
MERPEWPQRHLALAETKADTTQTDMMTTYEPEQQQTAVPLPETFDDGPRQFYQVWRGKSAAVYGRSALSTEDRHLYYVYNIRTIGGVEFLGELILESASVNKCVDRADKWERTK